MIKDLPYRASFRIPGFDYSSSNWYYITICSHGRESIFGDVIDLVGARRGSPVSHSREKISLNQIGQIANQCWLDIPNHYSNVKLDEYIIMPNHVHGIIIINTQTTRANNDSPLQRIQIQQSIKIHGTSNTIGAIVRGYKIGVTKWCRQNTNLYDVWQRNYYEHIIRDEGELSHIRQYIRDNPKNWETDKFHAPITHVGANHYSPVSPITHVGANHYSPVKSNT